MTSLTAIFGNSSEKPEDDELESEKLLNLYWNRAELKKEFAELRNEKLRLQERIAEQEGEAARSAQKLAQLEALLLEPANVYSTVTYFQLRALNMQCAAKIATFAENLKRQREQREHSKLVEQWNHAREQQAATVEEKLGEQRIQAQMLEDRLQAERHRLATMSGFVKLFRGRSVMAGLDELAGSIHVAQENERSLLLELDDIQTRQPPDTQGLDISTKRSINVLIMAYAQKLFLLLSKHDVAGLVNEAGEKSVGALHYGDKQSCEEILKRIQESFKSVAAQQDIVGEVQERAQLIAEHARYRNDTDAVPAPATISTIFDFSSDGSVRTSTKDLLTSDYWGLNSVLSR